MCPRNSIPRSSSPPGAARATVGHLKKSSASGEVRVARASAERLSKRPRPRGWSADTPVRVQAQTRLSASRHRLSWCGEELNERAIELVRRLFVRQMADAWERDQPDIAKIPAQRFGG